MQSEAGATLHVCFLYPKPYLRRTRLQRQRYWRAMIDGRFNLVAHRVGSPNR